MVSWVTNEDRRVKTRLGSFPPVFFSGGRRIVVTGNGFDLIQKATMKVLPLTDEFSPNITPETTSGTPVSDNLVK